MPLRSKRPFFVPAQDDPMFIETNKGTRAAISKLRAFLIEISKKHERGNDIQAGLTEGHCSKKTSVVEVRIA